MNKKHKQYKIEKGLMLFTQPKSPYYYGKIRLNRKYFTKSIAPITTLEEAKIRLYEWKDELTSKQAEAIPAMALGQSLHDTFASKDHVTLENDFQFLDVNRFDPKKKTIQERRINFIEIYENYNSVEAAGQAHRCLDCGNPYCEWKCPVHNYIPNWLKLVNEGNIWEAADLCHQTNSLPEMLSLIHI